MDLGWWADVSTVVSGVITLLIALIGSGGGVAYLVKRHRFRRKSRAVEEYLRDQKAEKRDKGQRSAENICRNVHREELTEEEIYKISHSNPRIQMRVRVDEDGFASKRLYEYVGEGRE